MSRRAVKAIIVAGVVLLEACVGIENAEAYTLVDWMRSWPNYYWPSPPAAPVALPATPPLSPTPAPAITTPPSITIPPSTATPPPVTTPPIATTPATTCGVPATTCGSPATTAGPAPVYAPSAPTTTFRAWRDWLFCRRPVGYRPEVRYRTRLMRVPTTNYRPVTTYDPMSGTATTSFQPCTTYSWQFRRIPYTTYQPVYSPVTTSWFPFSNPAIMTYYPGTAVSGAATTCASPPATPYYTPPATSPATTTTPELPELPPKPEPSTPADQPPSLSPLGVPPVQDGQSAPSTSKYPPLEPSGESTKEAPPHESKKEPELPAEDMRDLTPVPDPDAGGDRKSIPAAPSLFDPRERTAYRASQPAWAYSTIAWPEKPKQASQSRALTETSGRVVDGQTEALDSSGWHAVRP